MSKSKSFYGLRSGSTKSHTYAVLKGQQVTKDRVTDVANPRTSKQMIQRMIFANAVKFFKHGQAAFFKFAFEDKKRLESDYNAFMRHNSKNAVAVSRENYNDAAYPAFGRYTLTAGSLVAPVLYWDEDPTNVKLKTVETGTDDTVGALSTILLSSYPSLMVGDIVTILLVHTSLKSDGSMSDERVNRWDIRQFIIDPADERNSNEVLGVATDTEAPFVQIANVGGTSLDTTLAKGAAVVFSRNTPNGLKVSTSEIIGNAVAKQFIEQYGEEAMMKAMANTWGATGSAILQGSIAEANL